METFSKKPISLTLKDYKRIANFIYCKEEKPIRRKWFVRLMNRFGWHRKYTLIIIDENKLTSQFWLEKQLINLTNKNENN